MRTPLIAVAAIALVTATASAQRVSGSSASSVSAELIKGKLNPAESKLGDEITIRLKDDLKSSGDIVLKKGTIINGVVRNASRIDDGNERRPEAHSLIEIQWMTPPSQSNGSWELMVAVQSVIQLKVLSGQDDNDDWDAPVSTARAGRGLALLNPTIDPTPTNVPEPNTALLQMPSVVAAGAQTANSLHADLGMTDGQQLFKTGHGQIFTAGGYKESIDIFSHLNNDTVLTSPNRNFEISSGAELRLLVGMQRR